MENMKHGANKNDRSTKHAGKLNFKQKQSQNLNAPITLKSAKLV